MNYHNEGVGPSSSPETKQFTEALIEAQANFKTIAKSADNPAFRSKYATFEGASEALRPILTAAGFAMPTYHTGWYGQDMGWCCLGVLRHKSGEWSSSLSPLINLPGERKDFKTGEIRVSPPNMQGFGSAKTYAKRQLLLELTGAWVGENDDDGNDVRGERSASVKAPHPAQTATKSMEIAAKATQELALAKTADAGKQVLDRVKLRVSQKVCDPKVLQRLQGMFDEKFQEA
jgi:hypothetical protein